MRCSRNSSPLLLTLLFACKEKEETKVEPGTTPAVDDDSGVGEDSTSPPDSAAPVAACPASVLEMSGEPALVFLVTDNDTPVETIVVDVYLDGVGPWALSPDVSGTVQLTIPAEQRTVDPSHTFNLLIEPRDPEGNTQSTSCTFQGVDALPPSITVLSPVDGESLQGDATVSALVSDGFDPPSALWVTVAVNGVPVYEGPPSAEGAVEVIVEAAGISISQSARIGAVDTSGNEAYTTVTWNEAYEARIR